MTERTFAPEELASELGLHTPTLEQSAIIGADPTAPALVVAGAGSGKTETMALRTLWLIANGHAAPGEILGLTFTRKAAGELAARMGERIRMLRERGLIPNRAAHAAGDPGSELLDTPRVSTYNAFASALYRENAALIGADGDAVVLGETAAWLLARRLVLASDDPRLFATERSLDVVTGAVVALSAAIAENLVEPGEVRDYARSMERLAELPPGGRGAYGGVESDVLDRVRELPMLVDLATAFADAKAERGYIEFSDQIATAYRVVRKHPGVAEAMRAQYRFVILDEYQDTSVSQSRLLSELFRGHPVMAVGDPHQSIYGWRGASASNLAEFAHWFDAGTRLSLTTSWRNGRSILAAANRVLEPLTTETPVAVDALAPRPGADDIPVSCVYAETVADEAREIANWFRVRMRDRARWKLGDAGEAEPPTAALVLRARATLPHFLEAFRAAGVPSHVLGVGGLLAEPVVADLVAALTVIARADAGSELIRVLAGSRWRIGVKDIATLHAFARWLEKRDHRQQLLGEAAAAALRASIVADESASIVDALDFIAHAPETHGVLAGFGFSETGLARLRAAGALFAELRRRARLPLAELSTLVLDALELDIEAAANESRPGASRALEGFFDAVTSFEQFGHGAGLDEFLAWFREAQNRDRLAPRSDPPERGCVQILTIHGAKGLEWDLVAVPRLVQGELPDPSPASTGWLAFGGFPYALRGDRDSLPGFTWREAESRKDLLARLTQFKARERHRLVMEDRRLAYVAMTRARHELVLSGSFWSSQSKPRPPSDYLRELAEAGIVAELPEAPLETESNPTVREPDRIPWPRDPLGGRRARVEAAARAVVTAEPVIRRPELAREVRLLLEEHRKRLAGESRGVPPARVPASRFSDFVHDPDAALASVRRPMPERPYRATRLGTLFHSWVEDRAVDPSVVLDELDDAEWGLADAELVAIDAERFAELKQSFERSEWAQLVPVEIEREIHVPFDGRIVICKIDAVYERDGRFEVVDWKTGKAPADDAELERKQLQLALYRLAYARWSGVDPGLVDAAFFFVGEDRVIRPERLDSEAELLARWRAAFPAG